MFRGYAHYGRTDDMRDLGYGPGQVASGGRFDEKRTGGLLLGLYRPFHQGRYGHPYYHADYKRRY